MHNNKETQDPSKLLEQLLSGMGSEGNFGGNDPELANISSIYEILGKLSDSKESSLPEGEKSKQLYSLFENLLGFLMKSEMLAEPLSQIKTNVLNYLDNNKDKLKPEDEEKYKSILTYIDTILTEIAKPEPNKPLIIDVFYKLHELSDLDNDLINQVNPEFKGISDIFNVKK
jgi:hypothetical protein